MLTYRALHRKRNHMMSSMISVQSDSHRYKIGISYMTLTAKNVNLIPISSRRQSQNLPIS